MRNNRWKCWSLLAAGIVLVWCMAPAWGAGQETLQRKAQVIAQPAPRAVQVQVQAEAARPLSALLQAKEPQTVQLQVLAQPGELGDYWVGVQCEPLSEPLRAQLGLKEGEGLVVESVLPDSPAAKAGLKPYDVLAAVNGKPIEGLRDLIAAVQKAKDQEDLTLEVIRQGKRQELKVRPAKRPEGLAGQGPLVAPPGIEGPEELRRWFEKVVPEGTWGELLGPRFRIFGGPAVVLPPGARVHPPLPGNLSVSITKQGDEPAKIVVKRGDEKWELTEDELDKLPADIRPHVERMLGRVPKLDFRVFAPEERLLRPLPLPRPQVAEELEKRLDQMQQQLEELRRSLRELRQRRGHEQQDPSLDEAPRPRENAPKDEA